MPVVSPHTCEYLIITVFLPRDVRDSCAKYQPGDILRLRTISGYTLGCRIYRHPISIRGLFYLISPYNQFVELKRNTIATRADTLRWAISVRKPEVAVLR